MLHYVRLAIARIERASCGEKREGESGGKQNVEDRRSISHVCDVYPSLTLITEDFEGHWIGNGEREEAKVEGCLQNKQTGSMSGGFAV
jgi:hypothetical protein